MIEREKKTDLGTIKINNEVIAAIARLAAGEIDGVAGLKGNMINGLKEFFFRRPLNQGVAVEINGNEVRLGLAVIVKYGTNLPELAAKIQENVKNAVERMTTLSVAEIDISIQDIKS